MGNSPDRSGMHSQTGPVLATGGDAVSSMAGRIVASAIALPVERAD